MASNIHAILTDIEGTTSSIAFVKEVLFPYAYQHLPKFLETHQHEHEVAAQIEETRLIDAKPHATIAEIGEILRTWITEDRKITPLKNLQGLIWKDGYAHGEIKGHIYDDAAAKLKIWHARGLPLYVYSSGSIVAQQLLFAHTTHGDLTPLFSGYFDTNIGSKKDAASYSKIAAEIGKKPESILFLSDIADEIRAAKAAGMQVIRLVRPQDGTKALRDGTAEVESFAEINL